MTRSIRPGVGCCVLCVLCFASGNCAGGTLPAVDSVTGLEFSTATEIPSNPPPPVNVTVTDATKAQDAYRATLALPVFPPGTYNCPEDSGVSYQIAFLLASGSKLTVTAYPDGCSSAEIPGTSVRSVGPTYWSQLAQDLGIAENDIYPYMPPEFQYQAPTGMKTCTTDTNCDADHRCGYLVADGCTATGVCMVSGCTGGNCAIEPAGMCGCEGQTMLPVWSQSSASSVIVVYASAPSSGKVGPCTGVPDAGGTD